MWHNAKMQATNVVIKKKYIYKNIKKHERE